MGRQGSTLENYPLEVTEVVPPGRPSLRYPENNSIINDNTPTFRWENVTDPSGVTYELQYSTDPVNG